MLNQKLHSEIGSLSIFRMVIKLSRFDYKYQTYSIANLKQKLGRRIVPKNLIGSLIERGKRLSDTNQHTNMISCFLSTKCKQGFRLFNARYNRVECSTQTVLQSMKQ